jgi:hypothetical protein
MTRTEVLANTATEVQTLALQLFMDRWRPFNGIKAILLDDEPKATPASKMLPASLGVELYRIKTANLVRSLTKDEVHGLQSIYDYCQGKYTQLSLHRKLVLENADYLERFGYYVSVGPCLNGYTKSCIWRLLYDMASYNPELANHLKVYNTLGDLKNEHLTDNHPLGDRPGVELLRRVLIIIKNAQSKA